MKQPRKTEKPCKLYYADINNFGDQLNVLLLQQVFSLRVERHSFLTAELSAIGSVMEQYTLHGTSTMRFQQKLYGALDPKVYVWGTGFVRRAKTDNPFFKRDMRFCAVRGELTRRRVERLLGRPLETTLGDGGLLCSMLLNGADTAVQGGVGVIPHLCDLKDPAVSALIRNTPDAFLIDVRSNPYKVLRQISQCRIVLSSSLHGLTAADSLGIPNRHIVFSDRPLGDGFKYDDYYSAFGVPHVLTDLRKSPAPSVSQVEDEWPLTPALVEAKKVELLNAFPGAAFPPSPQEGL